MALAPLGQMIIELGLDSSNFATGMKGVNQQIKTSMTEMKAHLSVMGRSGSEIDKLKAKQTGLSGVIDVQNKKVQLAKNEYEACKLAVEGNADATQKQKDALIKAQNEYVKAVGQLGAYENQIKEVNIKLAAMESNTYKMGAALEATGKKLTTMGTGLITAGKAMTAAITAPTIALATAALNVTKDFESAMSQVQATMGITKDAMSTLSGQSVNTMEALGDLAKRMGAETKFSATEAAEAINNMAMAGYDTQQIYTALPEVLNLATAGALDLDYATQLAANGLNVMGLETSDLGELSDKLAVTASSAYGSVSDFGEGILKAGGQASIANVSLTDTLTALGILGDAGMSASEGGTMLRNVIKNLYTPTDKAREALDELGISTANSDGTLRTFQSVLQDLDGALAGLTDDEKVNAMSVIFDTRTISGANALLEASGDRFDELSAAIDASAGAAQKMTDTQLDNLSGQLTILGSAVEGIGISFGEIMLPAIKDVTAGVQSLADWLNNLDDKQKETIVRVASVVAVMGPAVLIVGKLTTGIGNLATNIGAGLQSFALWAAKITATTSATTAQVTATTASTAATAANTAATGKNTAGLLAKTAKTLLDTAAVKAHSAVEKAHTVALMASNGTLTAQAAAINVSMTAKAKDTITTAAHTVAEQARNVATGISTGTISLQTVATIAQTVATGACTVATGLLTAAITLLSGPIGWIIAGIGALVVGIISAVKWLTRETEASKQLKAETEELAAANDTLVDSLNSSRTSYEDNVKAIQTEAGAAKTLAAKVAALSKVENKSAAQKQELKAYVGMLNNSMEGLNVLYDEQADVLSMTTDEIYSQISALEKQAEAQAAQERLTEILKERISVNEQLEQVQRKVTEAEENDSLRKGERKEILEGLTAQEAALGEQLNSLNDSYTYVTDIIVESTEIQTQAVVENTQTILEAYGSIGNAYDDLGKHQQQAIDGITGAYETMTGKLSNLTEKIKLDNETTWEQIRKNQADTIVKTEEFSALYAQLIEAGVSESYLNAIGATGPESIPLLKDMLKQGTDAILASQDEWQNAYSVIGDTLVESLELDNTVRDALKDYVLGESGVYGTLQGAVAQADLNAIGKSLTDGVSQGILASTDNLEETAASMATATTAATEDAWEIHSPSKVFADMGKFLMEGLVQGLTGNEGLVYAKAESIANNVTNTVKKALDIHSPSGIMRDEVGKNIALGIAEGITSNKKYAKKSAEEIADAVVQAAKKKLDNTKVYTELTLADEVAYWDAVRMQVQEGTQARIDADKEYYSAKNAVVQAAKKNLDNTKVYTELTLADEVAYWNAVRKQVDEGTQARIDADKEYFTAKKSLSQKMVDIESSYTSKVSKLYEDLDKNIKSLRDSYANEVTSRTKDIMSSMNLFDEFTAKTELTTSNLISNLQSQVTGLKDWSNNLKELEKRGISGDMLEELRDMGTSAAGEIALITEMSDEELKEYVSLWKQKQRLAKKEATKELKSLAEETEEQIYQMRIAASKELDEYKKELVSSMAELGTQIQAPLVQVQTSLLNTMSTAVQMVAGTVSEESGKQSNVNQFSELATSVLQASQSLPTDFITLGENTVAGMIQGLKNKAGDLYQTMTEIVRNTIQVVKDEAQIHSPSRVMMSLGSYMLEGFGQGMENMQGYVEGVMRDTTGIITEGMSLGSSFGLESAMVLTDSTQAIRSMGRVIDSLDTESKAKNNQDSSEMKEFVERVLEKNEKMVTLLQMIAEKSLMIDKNSIVDVIDSGLGNSHDLKVREA